MLCERRHARLACSSTVAGQALSSENVRRFVQKMAVVWSNENTLTLIELYQNSQLLWDTSHSDYKNKIKKNDAWESIATTLDIPRKDVEGKIHNIRSQFLRERKKIVSSKSTGSGSGDVHKSNWFAYDSLLFLVKGATSSGSMDTMNAQVSPP